MPAVLYLDIAWSKVTSVATDSLKRLTLKRKYQRKPQFKWLTLDCRLNRLDCQIVLPEAVCCLCLGF
jgi:hypothetical protein